MDGLCRPSGRAGKEKGTGKKGAAKVQGNLLGVDKSWNRMEHEPEVAGVMEKDWQEEPQEQGDVLADVSADDFDDEVLDEAGERTNAMVEVTDCAKVILCANQELVSITTCPCSLHGTITLKRSQ